MRTGQAGPGKHLVVFVCDSVGLDAPPVRPGSVLKFAQQAFSKVGINTFRRTPDIAVLGRIKNRQVFRGGVGNS